MINLFLSYKAKFKKRVLKDYQEKLWSHQINQRIMSEGMEEMEGNLESLNRQKEIEQGALEKLTESTKYEDRQRRKKHEDLSSLEGVVTFFSSYHALKAEKILKASNCKGGLIPGPREISPNCGTALRFDYAEKDHVIDLFNKHFVQYEEIHYYPVTQKV